MLLEDLLKQKKTVSLVVMWEAQLRAGFFSLFLAPKLLTNIRDIVSYYVSFAH